MRKYFVTGLVILLPLTLTLLIVSFVFNKLTEPFAGAINSLFHKAEIFKYGFLFFSADQVEHFISQILILFLLIGLTLALGAITQWFFFSYLIKFTESLLDRIPVISSIYKTSRDVIQTIFERENQSFKQVVLVPFPKESTYSIGFLTGDNISGLQGSKQEDVVSVFIPTTPNPTSGFLMLFHPKDVIYLDMSIESAFKYIISCGVIAAPFNIQKPEQKSL